MLQDDVDLETTRKVPRVTAPADATEDSAPGLKQTLVPTVIRLVPLLFLLMLGFYLMAINLRQPWVSVHEDNGLVFMSSAVNNIRYGLGYTKGETVVDKETLNNDSPLSPRGVAVNDEFHYLLTGPTHPYIYPNHPPLLSLTVTASLLTFGYHFWAVRLVPLAFSLGAIAVFYFLVAYIYDYGVAFFSTFLLATFPMMAYFGRNVAFEAEVVFWLLVMLTGYAHWEKTGHNRWLALTGIAIVIGVLYDWPMFFFAFIVFTIDALSKRRINLRLASATLLPAFAGVFVAFGQDYIALNHTLKPLLTIFLIRSGNTGFGHAPVSIITWFNQVMIWNTEGYGLWSQIVIPFAILFVVSRASHEGASLRVRLVLITLLCGLAHVIAFREGAIIHAYWQQYFLPFYAITIGWAAVELVRHFVSAAQLRWIPLLTAAVVILAFNLPTIVSLYSSQSGVFVPILYLWK